MNELVEVQGLAGEDTNRHHGVLVVEIINGKPYSAYGEPITVDRESSLMGWDGLDGRAYRLSNGWDVPAASWPW